MKRTLIATVAATAAILAAAYLTGADSTATPAPAQPNASGTSGTPTQMQTQTPLQQFMQAPAVETEECEGYILLMPCPVCHTCPVCQANCGTAHALRCCLGNKKPAAGNSAASGMSGMPAQQHVMTNQAEAVKHAAGRSATRPPMETETGTLSIITVESD